jgi:hypothetical protein
VSTITHRSRHRPTPVIAAGRTRHGYRVDPNSAHPRATGCTPHQPLASESKPDEPQAPQPAPGRCRSDAAGDAAPRPLPLIGPCRTRRDHAADHCCYLGAANRYPLTHSYLISLSAASQREERGFVRRSTSRAEPPTAKPRGSTLWSRKLASYGSTYNFV